MTKAEAIALITKRLLPRRMAALTWAEFVSGMGDMDAGQKADLLSAVRENNAERIGNAVLHQIRQTCRVLAATDAEAALADDSLSLAELDKVL